MLYIGFYLEKGIGNDGKGGKELIHLEKRKKILGLEYKESA